MFKLTGDIYYDLGLETKERFFVNLILERIYDMDVADYIYNISSKLQ